jgi:hypothetical protein
MSADETLGATASEDPDTGFPRKAVLRYRLQRSLDHLETLRRTPNGTMTTMPSPPLVYEVRDYADPGLAVEAGAQALRESLPNGQLDRTVAAYNLLRQGTEDLGRWLRARGVPV